MTMPQATLRVSDKPAQAGAYAWDCARLAKPPIPPAHSMNLRTLSLCLALLAPGQVPSLSAAPLKAHGIFSSHMVLQRDKPVTIWGWADEGDEVTVSLGQESQTVAAQGKQGRWEAEFPAREASAEPVSIKLSSDEEAIVMENIVFGDVWVMEGQSNMAFGLGKTLQADLAIQQAHLPLLRFCKISTNEQSTLQTDIPAEVIPNGGWVVSSPETAGNYSAIGYHFVSHLQRALQIPIGMIDTSRGGASIESLVPHRKFDEHPIAKRYKAHVDARIAAFDPRAKALEKWERSLERAKRKKVPEDKWPKKPEASENLRSWDIPGMSPSDAGACYNGMFGAFIGLQIKGVIFHQGYNNAMSSNCRPARYRVLMKLMVEGWREDFKDPELAVGVIGFCAGGVPQIAENFELWSTGGAAYIREAQRLGLADVGDPEHTAFLPAHDVQIPGLHPKKKQAHGVRAARWALSRIYDLKLHWKTTSLISSKTEGDELILTFDQPVMPHDMSTIPRGFAIAGEDGQFYRAHARFRLKKDAGTWNTANKSFDTTIIHLWSPLVEKPVAARYGWATSPEANLMVDGRPWAPLASFRTDSWDYPESEDPSVSAVGRADSKAMQADAAERLAKRRQVEAQQAIEILKRLETLGRTEP